MQSTVFQMHRFQNKNPNIFGKIIVKSRVLATAQPYPVPDLFLSIFKLEIEGVNYIREIVSLPGHTKNQTIPSLGSAT